MKSTKYNFDKMQKADIDAIMFIENSCYEIGWSKSLMLDCIKSDYHCIVLKLKDEISAYAIVSIVLDEAHLLNMCVNPSHQGKGLGKKLLNYLFNLSIYHQCKTFLLEVRSNSPVALSLYQSSGFVQIGLRKNYYEDKKQRIDALVMRKTL